MAKLPKGMFRRPKRGYYTRCWVDGRDRWISLGTNYEEACTQFRELQSRQIPRSQMTVKQAAKKWLETYVKTQRNNQNQKLATQRVKDYLEPFLGLKLLLKVTSEDLRRFRLWLEKREMSRQSVKHVLSDARCFLNWCENTGLVSRSPFPKKLLPKVAERPPDRLSEAEIEAICSIREPYGFIGRLGLGTGLRWSELARAQASDVDRGCLVISRTKTGKIRRVPLDPELLAEIRGRVGKLVPYARSASGSYTRIARRLSRVDHFHPHQLRHTFSCRWLERGGSLAALQEILGHSTIVTTQRYARLAEDMVMAEAKRIHTVAITVATGS